MFAECFLLYTCIIVVIIIMKLCGHAGKNIRAESIMTS